MPALWAADARGDARARAHPVYAHVSSQDPDRLLEMDEEARRQTAAARDQATSLQDLVLELREARLQDRALIERLLDERDPGNGAEEPEVEEPERADQRGAEPAPAARRKAR